MATTWAAQQDLGHARDEAAKRIATGAKFIDEDVMFDQRLRSGAMAYMANYAGSSSFVLDMQDKRKLSPAQVRGVLNCLRADLYRENQPSVPVASDGDGFDRITGILLHASTTGRLKFPKIRLMDQDGLVIVLTIAGQKSRNPGTVNVTDAGSWQDRAWYGRIRLDGQFEPSQRCASGVAELLQAFAADPEGVAAAYGRLSGHCCFCSAELTDDRSIEVGYGPVCAKHYGLAWGAKWTAAA